MFNEGIITKCYVEYNCFVVSTFSNDLFYVSEGRTIGISKDIYDRDVDYSISWDTAEWGRVKESRKNGIRMFESNGAVTTDVDSPFELTHNGRVFMILHQHNTGGWSIMNDLTLKIN